MTQLKKTIQETVTKEVDVQLPHFTKVDNGRKFFAVISEEEVWDVDIYSFHFGINKTSLSQSNALNYTPCTREEFMAAYREAMNVLSVLPIEQPLFKEA